jgi:phosphoglycerate dehydrogenase-like enzyme
MAPPFLSRTDLTVGFAHVAYALGSEFAARATGIRHLEVRTPDELAARVGEADVLVVSGLWRNELIAAAPRLRFIQSISAGTDQYDRTALAARGIRLASAQGANERAVAEHAMALILALTRLLHMARDNQRAYRWRGMIADRDRREDELDGKTLVIVGFGRIGRRLAGLARAFGMRVIGVRRSTEAAAEAHELVRPAQLQDVLRRADFVALTCPLTAETRGLIGARELAAMRPSAHLINVARGAVVQEEALVAALAGGKVAGAGLDCFVEEPLPPSSPLWDMAQVIVTPHTAGETRRYEANVVDVLLDNLERLWRGDSVLRNQIV